MKTTITRSCYTKLMVLALGLCGTAVHASDDTFELVVGGHGIAPTRSADWNTAGGLEIQGRFWPSEHIGLALAGGFDTWRAKKAVTEMDDGQSYTYTAIAGDASVASLGASLLYRTSSAGDVNLILEFGLRYAAVESSVYAEAAYDGPGGPNYLYEKIDIANTMLFVTGVSLQFQATESVALTLGVGYQVDLLSPEETYAGESLGNTDFGATLFTVGLACRL